MTRSLSSPSHVLLTLGTLFTLTGVSRIIPPDLDIMDDASTVLTAQQIKADTPDTHSENDKMEKSVATPVSADKSCFTGEMAASLADDYWLFESERDELRKKELTLKEYEVELRERQAQLENLRTQLDQRWQEMQAAAENDIQHLSKMYGAMKPDEAAQIFDQMDPVFAAGFLRQISSDSAGLILASMEASKAYEVSLSLAAMNDDIRKR
ncbi:MAG: hypothetical protein AAF950_14380 [Pseudomonadota bacterium]